MRKTFKLGGIILLILIAISLALPFFMGTITEHKFKQVINEVATFSNLNIKVINYQKRWLDANATITIDLTPENTLQLQQLPLSELVKNLQTQKFTFTVHIEHGPFVWFNGKLQFAQSIMDSSIVLNDIQNTLLMRDSSSPPLITMQMLIKLTGKSIILIKCPPWNYQHNQHSLKWQGIELQLELSPTLKKIVRKINLPEFEIASPSFDLHIINLHAVYQGRKLSENLWIGNDNLSVQTLAIKPAPNSIIVNNLTVQSTTNEKNGEIYGSTAINIDDITYNTIKYYKNSLTWSYSNLNAAILAKLNHQLKSLSNNATQSRIEALKEMSQVVGLLEELLNNGATVKIDQLIINSPWGRFAITGQITFLTRPAYVSSPLDLINYISEDLYIQFDKPLLTYILQQPVANNAINKFKLADTSAQGIQQFVDLVEKTGLLVVKNNSYTMHISYKNGEILINNKPLTSFQVLLK